MQLFQSRRGATIYQAQSNPVFDAAVRKGRLRFGGSELFARSESAKPLIRAIRQQGLGFFNLPDMDFGIKDAAFVPFFGVPAATLLAPSRMARMLGMTVQPVVAEMLARRRLARALPAGVDRLAERRCAGRHAAHEPVDRSRSAAQPGAVPVGAQALQDAAARRARLLLTTSAG